MPKRFHYRRSVCSLSLCAFVRIVFHHTFPFAAFSLDLPRRNQPWSPILVIYPVAEHPMVFHPLCFKKGDSGGCLGFGNHMGFILLDTHVCA